MITCFIGVIGSGKDFRANELIKSSEKPTKKISFAEALRTMTKTALRVDMDYDEFKVSSIKIHTPKGDIIDAVTGREFLQLLGTDAIRRLDDNFWVNIVKEEILRNPHLDYVITDCRFSNEVEMLCHMGAKFIYCKYPSERFCPDSPHSSERLAQAYLNICKDGEDMTELVYCCYN